MLNNNSNKFNFQYR